MKRFPYSPRRAQGFTLIEILVVVSIIAILAALTTTGIRSAQTKAKRAETESRIRLIEDALQRYHTENGEYPTPTSEDSDGRFSGKTFNTGGSACLYQALTADGNDLIKGFKPHSKDEKEGSSTGEIGSSGGEVYLKEIQGSTKTLYGKPESGNNYVILDGFRQPFQYKPKNLKADAAAEAIHNETFDLWSYGANGNTNEDAEATKEWVKNW